jgi:hypothetical protein
MGDTIPDFTFYTTTGTPYNALNLLMTSKPLCMVAGSYTCPVWRGKITDLNNLITTYGSQVNFLVVYVCEAHPNTPDVSPYSCNVWTTSQNQTDGILYLQPTTYGARKTIATDMINNSCSCMPAINAPIVLDGPCNEWWWRFGPAPNNAYLIRPDNGTVYCKHGWFNQAPNDMGQCISDLLNLLAVENPQVQEPHASIFPNPASGQVSFSVKSDLPYNIEIFNVLGEKVSEMKNISGSKYAMNTEKLAAGVYSYRIVSQEEIIANGKLIIQ